MSLLPQCILGGFPTRQPHVSADRGFNFLLMLTLFQSESTAFKIVSTVMDKWSGALCSTVVFVADTKPNVRLVHCMWCECRCSSCCIVTQWALCLSIAGGEIFTSRYPFSESSVWSEWECWPPPGPWSHLCLSLLNLPCSFPPSHCPFDDVLGKAKRPGGSRHYSVKELGEIPLLLLV